MMMKQFYKNMEIIYKENGDYILALKMYQSALGVCSVSLTPDHVNIAITYNNMSNAYNETDGYNLALNY